MINSVITTDLSPSKQGNANNKLREIMKISQEEIDKIMITVVGVHKDK